MAIETLRRTQADLSLKGPSLSFNPLLACEGGSYRSTTKEHEMFGIFFRVAARPGKHEELRDFLRWDGEHARDHEPGTLRFEFYRDPQDDNAFYVYEAYRDRNAFEEHKKGEPFQRWSAGLRDAL